MKPGLEACSGGPLWSEQAWPTGIPHLCLGRRAWGWWRRCLGHDVCRRWGTGPSGPLLGPACCCFWVPSTVSGPTTNRGCLGLSESDPTCFQVSCLHISLHESVTLRLSVAVCAPVYPAYFSEYLLSTSSMPCSGGQQRGSPVAGLPQGPRGRENQNQKAKAHQ